MRLAMPSTDPPPGYGASLLLTAMQTVAAILAVATVGAALTG
jgi:hypothetical protein